MSKYNYFDDDLGANYSETSTTFKLWAPLLEKVTLNIYSTTGIIEGSYPMIEGNFGVFERRIPGNLKNKEYTFSFKDMEKHMKSSIQMLSISIITIKVLSSILLKQIHVTLKV